MMAVITFLRLLMFRAGALLVFVGTIMMAAWWMDRNPRKRP
jgi:hypothetical protein